jgi:hypothetical protein
VPTALLPCVRKIIHRISDFVRPQEGEHAQSEEQHCHQQCCGCIGTTWERPLHVYKLHQLTPEPIEQRDAGSVRHPRSSSAILRKRILGVFLLVLCALMSTVYFYSRSTYLGSTDWPWFWVGEVIVGVLVVVGIVQVLRKGP